MSFGRIVKGMAVGSAASVAVVASIALLVSGRLADVRDMQIYHCSRTYSAVRRIHISLMQGDNYRRLFPEERADEIRSMASLVVHAMVVQVDSMYQQDAIDYALNNLTKICSEE